MTCVILIKFPYSPSSCWRINVLPSLFHQISLLVALARACTSTWYRSQEVSNSRPGWRNKIAAHLWSMFRPEGATREGECWCINVLLPSFFHLMVFWLHWLEYVLLQFWRFGFLQSSDVSVSSKRNEPLRVQKGHASFLCWRWVVFRTFDCYDDFPTHWTICRRKPTTKTRSTKKESSY